MKTDGPFSWRNLLVGGVLIAIILLIVNQSARRSDADNKIAMASMVSPSESLDTKEIAIPIAGLTPDQLRKFHETEKVFKKQFTPEEGLGPLFNDTSCFACHGQPGRVGSEGRDVTTTGVIRIGKLRKDSPFFGKPRNEWVHKTTQTDVYNYILEGGPALERKSITSEFRNKYPAEAACEIGLIPKDCDFISLRHAQSLLGLGLLDAIDDKDVTANIFRETDIDPDMAGRAVPHDDPLTKTFKIGKFGWKAQQPTLFNFTAEAMDVEMGLTTPTMLHPKSAKGVAEFPHALIRYLPKEPNDEGKLQTQLFYFQACLAPPERGPITEQVKRGEKVFDQAQCSVCHMPTMYTKPQVMLPDPDSPQFPRLNWIEVEAFENKPVHAYTDLLVHNMGWQLADGLPQNGAAGGEWRTAPLWGLSTKRFLLHDGRTTNIEEAIKFHHGQAEKSRAKFLKLSPQDKSDLLAFLKSL